MANCAICGRPVLAGKVYHSACADQHRREELAGKFCDNYCRFPRDCHDDADLEAHCDACPVVRLLALK